MINLLLLPICFVFISLALFFEVAFFLLGKNYVEVKKYPERFREFINKLILAVKNGWYIFKISMIKFKDILVSRGKMIITYFNKKIRCFYAAIKTLKPTLIEDIQYFRSLNFIILLFIVGAVFSLDNQIINLFDEKIVLPYLSEIYTLFEDITFATLIIFIFSIGLAYYSYYKSNINLTPSWFYILSIYLIEYVRLYNRYYHIDYTLYGVNIPYLVLLSFVFVLCVNIKYLRNLILEYYYEINEKKSDGALYNDSPLKNLKDDQYGWEETVRVLKNNIKNSDYNTAFTIGITSKWGDGKTTFLNFLDDNLKEESLLRIHFNPWLSGNKNNIIDDFFKELNNKVKFVDTNVSKELIKYAKALNSFHSTPFFKSVIDSSSLLASSPQSIRERYKSTSKSLKMMKKKIVVFIDDLDRLDKDEIPEIMRLVRNTSNFPNMYFVLAYDRDYVDYAIKEGINKYSYEQYLNKIIQLEIELPKMNRQKLNYILVEYLKNFLNEDEIELLPLITNPHEKLENVLFIEDFFQNIRDLKNFMNHFIIDYDSNDSVANIRNFFLLSLLRFKHKVIWEILSDKGLNRIFLGKINNDYYSLIDRKELTQKLLKYEELLIDNSKLIVHELQKFEVEENVMINNNLESDLDSLHEDLVNSNNRNDRDYYHTPSGQVEKILDLLFIKDSDLTIISNHHHYFIKGSTLVQDFSTNDLKELVSGNNINLVISHIKSILETGVDKKDIRNLFLAINTYKTIEEFEVYINSYISFITYFDFLDDQSYDGFLYLLDLEIRSKEQKEKFIEMIFNNYFELNFDENIKVLKIKLAFLRLLIEAYIQFDNEPEKEKLSDLNRIKKYNFLENYKDIFFNSAEDLLKRYLQINVSKPFTQGVLLDIIYTNKSSIEDGLYILSDNCRKLIEELLSESKDMRLDFISSLLFKSNESPYGDLYNIKWVAYQINNQKTSLEEGMSSFDSLLKEYYDEFKDEIEYQKVLVLWSYLRQNEKNLFTDELGDSGLHIKNYTLWEMNPLAVPFHDNIDKIDKEKMEKAEEFLKTFDESLSFSYSKYLSDSDSEVNV
ncbi:P-loop NTPase fold protein [Flammeovirga sp. SubArs3]|uniref:KAP family P-loop NTPase fold protein n=1 Tax=Flammeovirga sp. SubArs3 TaxID=2995316 RepID=UPI00248CA009|nr:P-loop NTPase fold protein [Flammeovirga sp. SubArs3]